MPASAPSGGRQGVNIRPLAPGSPPEVDSAADVPHPAASETASALVDESSRIALPGAAEIAARNKAKSPSNSTAEAPGLEKITSAPAEKAESINAAKEVSQTHPSLDHLSAPASQLQSGAATPQTEPATGPEIVAEAARSRTHRGSEVKDAPPEEIRRLESASALQEDPAEDAAEDAVSGVGALKFEEPERTRKQDAKEAGDASKSVAD